MWGAKGSEYIVYVSNIPMWHTLKAPSTEYVFNMDVALYKGGIRRRPPPPSRSEGQAEGLYLYIISKEVTKHLPEKEKTFVSCWLTITQLFPPFLSYIESHYAWRRCDITWHHTAHNWSSADNIFLFLHFYSSFLWLPIEKEIHSQ